MCGFERQYWLETFVSHQNMKELKGETVIIHELQKA